MPDFVLHNAPFGKNPRRIKILFVIPSFGTGGAEIQLLSLVKGLDKSKFAVTVVSFFKDNELEVSFKQIPNVDIFICDKKGVLDFSCFLKLHFLAKRKKIDIIQAYNISARLIGFLIAKSARVPYFIATERTARLIYSSKGSRYYLFFEKFVNRWADVVIANSLAGREFAISRGVNPSKIKVIYNGIDNQRITHFNRDQNIRQKYNIPQNAYIVGMVARLDPYKDPFTFLKTAASICKAHQNFYFILVGGGLLLNKILDQVDELNLADRFICTGSRKDVADFIRVMDIVVLTSLLVEGCSNVILEAMSLGKPVIATNVGGNSELVKHGHTGFLIHPQKPAELEEAILILKEKTKLGAQFSKNAAELVKSKFSQKQMVAAHQDLYYKLAGQIEN